MHRKNVKGVSLSRHLAVQAGGILVVALLLLLAGVHAIDQYTTREFAAGFEREAVEKVTQLLEELETQAADVERNYQAILWNTFRSIQDYLYSQGTSLRELPWGILENLIAEAEMAVEQEKHIPFNGQMEFILYDETMRVRHSNRFADGRPADRRTRRTLQLMTLGEMRLERLELGDASSPSLICGAWFNLDEWILEIRITIPEELFDPFFRRIATMQGLSFIAATGIYSAEDGMPAWKGFSSSAPGLSAFAADFPPRGGKGAGASWKRDGTSTKYRIALPWTGTEQRSTYFRTPQILFIQLDFDAMKNIFSRHRTALLGVIILFSVAVLLLFWNVANETSRPFSRIAEEMLRFAALKERFSRKNSSRNARITEIIDLEQAFDSMSEEVTASLEKMRQADRTKNHFLSVVSHELRTPLTSILGFSKLLRRRLESVLLPLFPPSDGGARAVKDSIEELDIIFSEAERLTTLINDLLDMAKLDAGKMEWHMEWYPLSEVTEQALAATRILFNEDLVSVRSSVSRSLPALYGDRRRILQVLLNLLSNAAKFTLSGEVLVSATLLGDEVEVSVADTGIGIPPENLLSIFEKFRQVNEGPEQHHQGTGLGLSICREIVEYHGGRIWAENAPKRGSVFRFTLPVRIGDDGETFSSPHSVLFR